MKTSYSLIILLFISFVAQAQINKGDAFLGGAVSYYNNSQKTDATMPSGSPQYSTQQFIFSPSYGWAVNEHSVWGLRLSYVYDKTVQPYGQSTFKSNSYGAGIFLREYKYLGSRFYVFGQSSLSVFYGTGSSDNDSIYYSTIHSDVKDFGAGLTFFPGVAYRISPRWQIEADFPSLLFVNYAHTKETDASTRPPESHITNNNFSIGSNLTNTFTLGIGLLYVIGKK